jgi:dihydroorotate dehydrogenase electron transfer subunit
MNQNSATVLSNIEIMPEVHLLWSNSPSIAAKSLPGHFVMVRCGEGFAPLLRRPFSIHEVRGSKIALLFSVVGQGTKWLSHRRKGETLDLIGPLGRAFDIYPASQNLLLVAGGIGIAPLLFLAKRAIQDKFKVAFLIGANTISQIYPEQLLPEEIKVFIATVDGSKGAKGLITDFIGNFIGWADQIFACGPFPMYQSLARMPELKNVSTQVLLEQRFGCGVGACLGCVVKMKRGLKRVCYDGPVFDLDEILLEE